jgi:hypothetical protein
MHMKFDVGGRVEARQQVLNEKSFSSTQLGVPPAFVFPSEASQSPRVFLAFLSVVTINSDYSLRNYLTDFRSGEIVY